MEEDSEECREENTQSQQQAQNELFTHFYLPLYNSEL